MFCFWFHVRGLCVHLWEFADTKPKLEPRFYLPYIFPCKPIPWPSLSPSLSRWLIPLIRKELLLFIYTYCLIIHLTKDHSFRSEADVYVLYFMSEWGEKVKIIHIQPSISKWIIGGEKGSHERGIRNSECRVLPQCLTPDFQLTLWEIVMQQSNGSH